MTTIYDFTNAMKNLTWEKPKKIYHDNNEMLDSSGEKHARDIQQGLYLYLYSNHDCEHCIHNQNRHHSPPNGLIICPPNHHTLKSGKFEKGLHEKVRNDIHGHPWHPDAKPPQSYIWPQIVCWFLVFETNPVTKDSGYTREGYFNRRVRQWLKDLALNVPSQQGRLEHRFVRRQEQSPPKDLSKQAGKKFLESLLKEHPGW